MSARPFRLAVISDVHLAPMPAMTADSLTGKRLTGFLNWHLKRKHHHDMAVLDAVIAKIQSQQPDHILFCGDAVNIGLPAEFVRARQFLEVLGAPETVTAIPGNHDLYVESARAPMMDAFGPWMLGDHQSQVQFPFVRQRGDVALIGLNSSLPTPPFNASGRLGASQIAVAKQILSKLPGDTARMIALHHPATMDGTAKGRDLTDAAEFTAMMRGVNADIIIHGHNHYRSLHFLDGAVGKIPVLGVMSGSGYNKAFGGIPGWMMVEVSRSGGAGATVSVTAHEWRSDRTFAVTKLF